MALKIEICSAILIAFTLALITPAESGCWQEQLCCTGKNVTCKASGARMNDAITGKRSRVCFCDEYCLGLKDCCQDYHDTCKPVDCVFGGWEQWGKCSVQCGYGQKSRNRTVLVKPRNGGKDCGVYQEMKYCHGTNCKRPRHTHSTHQHRARAQNYGRRRRSRGQQTSLIETAKVIPASFGSFRKSKLYDPFNDIRRNLFNHYSANSIIKRPAYCAHFEVTHTKGRCNMRNQYQGWTQMLTKGQTICVECQPLAMKRKLGVRCSGDGIYLKETRWNAITMPGCHGKWMLKTEHRDCTCDPNSEMSFILL